MLRTRLVSCVGLILGGWLSPAPAGAYELPFGGVPYQDSVPQICDDQGAGVFVEELGQGTRDTGFCDGTGTVAVASPCAHDDACHGGLCIGGDVCDGLVVVPAGTACTTNPDCGVGGTCVASFCDGLGTVAAGVPLGTPCTVDEQCGAGGGCVAGFCDGNAVLALTPCVTDADCGGGLCLAGSICDGAGAIPLGAPCLVDADCVGGACLVAAVCNGGGTVAVGTPCASDNDCGGGTCVFSSANTPFPADEEIRVFSVVNCDPLLNPIGTPDPQCLQPANCSAVLPYGTCDPAVCTDTEAWAITIQNVSGMTFQDVYFVSDSTALLGNNDGSTNTLDEAFRIDAIGSNQPLLAFTSPACPGLANDMDEDFEPGECWSFMVVEWLAISGEPPAPYNSLGLGFDSLSGGLGDSRASIAVIPEPDAMLALLAGIGFLYAVRPRSGAGSSTRSS